MPAADVDAWRTVAPVAATDLPGSIEANIAEWTRTNAAFTDEAAEHFWQRTEITWGLFGLRDDLIGSPLGEVAGLDIVELGCGTAFLSASLARRDADRLASTRHRASSLQSVGCRRRLA